MFLTHVRQMLLVPGHAELIPSHPLLGSSQLILGSQLKLHFRGHLAPPSARASSAVPRALCEVSPTSTEAQVSCISAAGLKDKVQAPHLHCLM